jgi:hypothetical protein
MSTGTCVLMLIFAAVPLAGRAEPVDAASKWSEANAAFEAQKYDVAAVAYQAIVDAGVASADVYFNLGTAEYMAGRRGFAVLAFERALRLDPGDADAAFNLEEALKGNADKIVGVRDEEPLLERIGSRIPQASTAVLFIATWIFCWSALLVRLLTPRMRGLLTGLAVATGVVAVLSGAALATSTWVRTHVTYAVIVSPVASIREGPAKTFRSPFEVHEGLKVRVVQREQDFLRVRLPNGIEGWVNQNDAPTI